MYLDCNDKVWDNRLYFYYRYTTLQLFQKKNNVQGSLMYNKFAHKIYKGE